MAYVSTADERYGGSYYQYPAGYYDAPSTLNSIFVLKQDGFAYGALTYDNLLDQDVYSLGVLNSGYYKVDVNDVTWDFGNYDYGSVASFSVLDSYGGVVGTSYGSYADINFIVNSAETYYVKLTGNYYNSAQYSLTYTKTGEINSPAIFGQSTYNGSASVGSYISVATFNYFDANGNADRSVGVGWYVDGIYQVLTDSAGTFLLLPEYLGKTLSFRLSFFDDLGNFEISDFYVVGKVLEASDTTAPTVSIFSPLDAANGVAIGSNITVTFSENIQRGTGNIVLKDAANNVIANYDAATSANLSISGAVLTINPSSDLSYSTQYFVTFAAATIKDVVGNSYIGTSAYDFTTVAAPDTTAPSVSIFSPLDAANGVAIGSNITVTFSENIQRGTGNIVLKDAANNVIATYDAALSTNLSISGLTLTIDPTNDLSYGTQYYVTFSSGTIKDLTGNSYTGTSTYDFTTASLVGQNLNGTTAVNTLTGGAGNDIITGPGGIDILNASNRSPTGTLTVKGKFSQGGTLTVTNAIADKDGIPKAGSTGAISYTWYANAVQIDAATSTLLLNQEHVGKSITVKVSYTDLLGTAESVTSPSSALVANINDAPTGSVFLSGTASQGQTLVATNTLADLDGLGTVTYQWNAGGKAIVGATSDSYVLTQVHVGQTISVTASYTDGFGKAERVNSAVSAKVANVNDAPAGQITMTGNAAEDQTLTANTSTLVDADGLGKLSFQWQSSTDGSIWTNVAGANKAAFKLGDAHVGRYVRVNVAYTDKLGTAESVTSEASALVSNVNDKPKGVPTVSGKFIEGEILTANTSTITDADGLGTFSYLWQTSTDKKTWVDAGTDVTLQLSATSAKQSVQLTVSYTDGGGTAESVKSTVSKAIVAKAQTLVGGNGNETLTGWSGADKITGGGGADTLTGGAGADVFIYSSVDDSLPTSFDNILDFSSADKINLKGIDANQSIAKDQAFVFSKTGAANNAVWWDSGTLYGDNTGDAAADFAIAITLVGLLDIKASNIIL